MCNSQRFHTVLLACLIILLMLYTNFSSVNITPSTQYIKHDLHKHNHSETNIAINNDNELPKTIPLNKLVNGTISTEDEAECKEKGGFMFHDTILPESITHANRKIPKVIHVTSRSRCISTEFYGALNDWRLPNHSIYLHDEDAIDKLLFKKWDMFPHLQEVMKCIGSGAEKADIWRYLVIYEYGGIYTDIDNRPGRGFSNGDEIKPTDDAYFLKEIQGGFPSQWFFAAALLHPILYFSVFQSLIRLLDVANLKKKYIPSVTGPGAIKMGFINFMNEGYPNPGTYTGIDNRNVTIGNNHKGIVARESVRGQAKQKGLKKMGMVSYGVENPQRLEARSCLHQLYYKRNETLKAEDMRFGIKNV